MRTEALDSYVGYTYIERGEILRVHFKGDLMMELNGGFTMARLNGKMHSGFRVAHANCDWLTTRQGL